MAYKARPSLCFVLIQLLQFCLLGAESKITSIIVFGDSSVDTGNNNQLSTIARSDFEPYGRDFVNQKPTGRFSNGRVATDFISEAFGLKPAIPAYLDPAYNISDYVNGVCFASAATGYDNATSDVLNVIPLWKQLEYFKTYQQQLRSYLGEQQANRILADALYMISMGTNDFLENYYALPVRSRQYNITEYEDFLVGIAESFVRDIYNQGGRKISVGGLPPIGCMPLERAMNARRESDHCVDELNNVAREFNKKIEELVATLTKQLEGIGLVFSDIFVFMLQIIQNPSQYGFENAATGCCATGVYEMGYTCDKYSPFTCRDANVYVFWDAFHPTERTNKLIAGHVMNSSLAQFV